MLPSDPPSPPLLWGGWRCTTDPRVFAAPCTACGGQCLIHRFGTDLNGRAVWRAACENGCSREDMDAAADVLADTQRREQRMEMTDPLYGIPAETYIEALVPGIEGKRDFYRCPFHGDGDERTPSLRATGMLWHCFSCKRGGSVIDFAAELWGITPRKDGYEQIHDRLVRALPDAAREIKWPD